MRCRIAMKRFICLSTTISVLGLCAALTAGASGSVLEWAYSAHVRSSADPDRSSGASSERRTQSSRDPFNVLDSAPDHHPSMPPIVSHGRRPAVMACGFCHRPDGFGRPDNANLAGLPAAYIVQQMTDYKTNQRRSANPHGGSTTMASIARAVDEADIDAAARYFSSVAPQPWIRVIETNVLSGNDGHPVEPIGTRVVEVPDDATSGFVAYVPMGSLKRGEALVTTGGGGRTVRCALCHGHDLRGTSSVPGIAGRSPSYLARQLNDMRQGSRFGARPDRMMGTVARLTEPDIVSIVAYAASLHP